RKNLKLYGEGEIIVVNLKCDTRLIGSFREEPGIFPGWHMNKAHWLTVAGRASALQRIVGRVRSTSR
ncbi:MAG: MmcQ/YjbR family DNA-binding protein, partial [Oscillospiraceae bacterium]|nr:MmcQ/YjbR family DNA-binding protein [Oscillospiraceae bacterium]